MVIPDTFGIRGERVLASYDYFDIASTTGYKTIYGMTLSDASRILNETVFYSDTEQTKIVADTDFDYDISFKIPMTIEGDAIISFPIRRENTHSSVAYTFGYIATIKLIHYDGSTETILDSTTVEATGAVAPATNEKKIRCISLTIPKTRLQPGDILRLSTDIDYTGTVLGNLAVYIGHDPINRNTGDKWIDERLRINVPFKINL